jgi:hypothetical protein
VAVEATEVQLLSTYSLDMSLSSHSFPWTQRVNPIYTHTLHTPFLEVCLSEQPTRNNKKIIVTSLITNTNDLKSETENLPTTAN